MLIDQTWIRKWGDDADPRTLLALSRWVLVADPAIRELAMKLPPHSVVRKKASLAPYQLTFSGSWEEIPFPTTCGVVEAYCADGQVRVHQAPGSAEFAWIRLEDLDLVRVFGCMSSDYIKAVAHMGKEAVSTNHAHAGKESFHVRSKGGG